MRSWWMLSFAFVCLSLVLLCHATVQMIGRIYPEFAGSQINFIDSKGLFLVSSNSKFAFGFTFQQDVTLFSLAIVHLGSSVVVWTAGSMVGAYDKFVFDKTGNVYLEKQGGIAWSPSTKGVTAIELLDSGNLVLIGNNSKHLWQSFSYPTDTLLPNQIFSEGMRLESEPNSNNLSFYLEMKAGEVTLFGRFRTPQPYWSLEKDLRKTINNNGVVTSCSLISNSWRFFDHEQTLVYQFNFSPSYDFDSTWVAALGTDGFISFSNLESATHVSPTKIPQNECSTPEHCDPYYICDENRKNFCICAPGLETISECIPWTSSPCNSSKSSVRLLKLRDEVDYFALGFSVPVTNLGLHGCMDACLNNCSCLVLFFENTSGNCFLFDYIGSFQWQVQRGSFSSLSYIKVPDDVEQRPGRRESSIKKHLLLVLALATAFLLLLAGLLFLGIRYHVKTKRIVGSFKDVWGVEDSFSEDVSTENAFMESLSQRPIRFSYTDLQTATGNFSVKLGVGGFGSVYKGTLPDGIQIAVKKLEGVGQGAKEFRAEIATIGSICHVNLVKLRGFCIEGIHRLLAYEYMGNGSLDRWIFRNDGEGFTLDWEARFNIILGVAKGLAYLHNCCSSKIVHCDIKPENVLLDGNYQAKISDFGMAKLMTRDRSSVLTMPRGTRGYLAPEWVTNIPISDKSDVYSFGIVLLEVIGGRRNFKPDENSEKAHLPTYAIKKMEEGKPKEVIDSKLNFDEHDERVLTAIKIALWCIQRDMSLRPSMDKVIQMLEGSSVVPQPPSSSQMVSHFYENFVRPTREEPASTVLSYRCSHANLSGVQLSGPR